MPFFTDGGWDYLVWVWTGDILAGALAALEESDYVASREQWLLSRRAIVPGEQHASLRPAHRIV
jgi:hypothetical protein